MTVGNAEICIVFPPKLPIYTPILSHASDLKHQVQIHYGKTSNNKPVQS